MESRKRTFTLVLSAVAALICVAGYFAAPRLLDRHDEVLFRYKTARDTTATVVRKEHRVNARPEWVVYYRIAEFPIYSFHQNKTGQWEQGDLDLNTTRTLYLAEQKRDQQSGDRETSVSQNQYDSLSVGDRLDVKYRLGADDESVEIIKVERASP